MLWCVNVVASHVAVMLWCVTFAVTRAVAGLIATQLALQWHLPLATLGALLALS